MYDAKREWLFRPVRCCSGVVTKLFTYIFTCSGGMHVSRRGHFVETLFSLGGWYGTIQVVVVVW